MIFILSGDFSESELCARDAGLLRSDWRCFHDAAQLDHHNERRFWVCGSWHDNGRAKSLFRACLAAGIDFEARSIVVKKRNKNRRL